MMYHITCVRTSWINVCINEIARLELSVLLTTYMLGMLLDSVHQNHNYNKVDESRWNRFQNKYKWDYVLKILRMYLKYIFMIYDNCEKSFSLIMNNYISEC